MPANKVDLVNNWADKLWLHTSISLEALVHVGPPQNFLSIRSAPGNTRGLLVGICFSRTRRQQLVPPKHNQRHHAQSTSATLLCTLLFMQFPTMHGKKIIKLSYTTMPPYINILIFAINRRGNGIQLEVNDSFDEKCHSISFRVRCY
ncbi:uncharacterized protein LOC117145132 [Drosophila mauritiana]|uniref:Uncharacterized protein LOC117145132 n=1 Tax=Drosophila mauritiana TaxID=7226 RepID=A0A6P8KCJ9_DROMA|nr:uncharacterized protein LOC117145132 [Drosophila mauritiana]